MTSTTRHYGRIIGVGGPLLTWVIGFTVLGILRGGGGRVDAFCPTCFQPSLPSSFIRVPSPTALYYSREKYDDDSRKNIISSSFDGPIERRTLLQSAAAISSVLLLVNTPFSSAQAAYIDPATSPLKITDSVYFDVEYYVDNTKQQGRIVIDVFGDAMPKVASNFVTLAKSNAYAGTTFYRIISELSIQGGAIGDPTGKTGKSSLDNNNGSSSSSFEPDNYSIQHTQKGLVSMVRRNTKDGGGVDSRFFIQLQDDAGWADDRYAAFGRVTQESFDKVVSPMAKVPVQPPKNNPIQEVTIVASGIL